MATRILYIDDSGAESTGYVLYGWAEIDLAQWSAALRCLLDFRKKLYADTGIPADLRENVDFPIPPTPWATRTLSRGLAKSSTSND
ncbi:hypothetical protein, partial [Streptomyces sp. NPDC058394]|uniref:hypothetical protein n=1 Tax=Streptomyces sp. NPDC058394 TaxID=3346477 RepID=UPI0036462DB4